MPYSVNDTGHVTVHNSIAVTLAALPTTYEPIGLSATTRASLSVAVGQPTYISATQPTDVGPLLWIKDFGGGNYSLIIKTP